MNGGKIVHPLTGNQQADPKKQKLESEDEDEEFMTTEGLPREERLNLYLASFKDQTKFIDNDYDEDLNGPHSMTMREFASCLLDDIEHGNFDVEEDYSNIEDASVVLRLYDPEANLMPGEKDMINEITECANLAIGEYNGLNNTHFELERVIKANVEALSPYRYYITFDARDPTKHIVQSFQAMVAVRIPTTLKIVELVRIRKPFKYVVVKRPPAAV